MALRGDARERPVCLQRPVGRRTSKTRNRSGNREPEVVHLDGYLTSALQPSDQRRNICRCNGGIRREKRASEPPVYASAIRQPTKSPPCHDNVAHVGRLPEKVLDGKIPSGVNDAKRLPVARHERWVIDVADPPEVLPTLHGDRSLRLSTYCHRVARSFNGSPMCCRPSCRAKQGCPDRRNQRLVGRLCRRLQAARSRR
jgi:hypothetical protein